MVITNDRSEKMQRDDDHASAIAEKLLEGWTLLAEYCPMEGCLAPLMRSREGQRYCVAHDMFVMTPEEADAMKKSGGGVSPSRTHATPAAEPPMERIDFYQNLKNGGARGGGGGGTPTSRLGRAATAAPAAMDVSTLGCGSGGGGGGRVSAAAARGGGSGGEGVVDVKATAQRTVETLAGKMEEARVILAASKDFVQCSELIKFIEECAAAIKSCEGI